MNLTDPETLLAFLDRNGLSARKGLGQHFLCSEEAVQAILGCLRGFTSALEIGPGPGVLTGPLTDLLRAVVTVEIDGEMAAVLAESAPKARVIRADVLKTDLALLLADLPRPRAVVSNLPYNITAALLQRVAQSRDQFDKAVLMMQKEVARRITAGAGESERGSLSVYMQGLFAIRTVAEVSASAFVPPPKVNSSILEFVPRDGAPPDDLWPFVRKGFLQPRKTLANNLTAAGYSHQSILWAFQEIGLRETVRPHQLTFDMWRALCVRLS